ncbi:MAG: hypothetical protein HC886_17535 [Leptolyngbyaceae cyanobacterium SM1_1_3]|nr:hypothetical protein [Leptolyngbyaceae cyanobacterium SM1_1_3]
MNLVATLPPASNRQNLYERLLVVAPEHIGLNRRYAQMLAQTDKAAALAYAQQLTPSDPTQIGLYFVQGEVAQALGELTLASQPTKRSGSAARQYRCPISPGWGALSAASTQRGRSDLSASASPQA